MNELVDQKYYDELYADIKSVLTTARKKAVATVNTTMVHAYWTVGKLIVEAQGGEHKAAYGENLIDRLAQRLTTDFGKGFTRSNLRTMRQFYLMFPNCHSLSGELSWTHYRQLIRVGNDKARKYYAEEAVKGCWSVRELERQIAIQHYERLLSTHRDKAETKEMLRANLPVNADKFDPLALVHDPFILEFLDVKPDAALQESELESAIISHL